MKKTQIIRRTALLMLVCLLFSSCGEEISAVSMHLRKTEGTVGVLDSEGLEVQTVENLALYSGYNVDTETESYAWIDLDSVKLAKLDQNSEVEVEKEDKLLTVNVKSGSLFFNVTEPLADDEAMEIRTSTMMVGIRGTCGWVSLSESGTLWLYLLEGTVACTVTLPDGSSVTETVTAGQKAELDPAGAIRISELSGSDVPRFVRAELEGNTALAELDAKDPLAAYMDVLAVLPPSDGTSPGLLLSEMLDFEGDGSPELLVITLEHMRTEDTMLSVRCSIYRQEPEGVTKLWRQGCGMDSEDKISLVECGGHLYLHFYNFWTYMGDPTPPLQHVVDGHYYGSTAQRDGEARSSWGCVDQYEYTYFGDLDDRLPDGSIGDHDERGFTSGAQHSPDIHYSGEELFDYLSKYTEVRDLIVCPDDFSIIVAP